MTSTKKFNVLTATHEEKLQKAKELHGKGMSNAAIAKALGLSESSIRTLLKNHRGTE